MWKIYAASGHLFTDIWSWQSFVSSYYVLTAFSYWIHKMKYSCYQRILLLFVAGLFIGLRRLTKSNRESSFSKLSLLHLAGYVRGLESLKLSWPYLMAFSSCISTGKPELLYCIWCVFHVLLFFFSGLNFYEVERCVWGHFTHICKIVRQWSELDGKRSEEYIAILLVVKRKLCASSSSWKIANTAIPA